MSGPPRDPTKLRVLKGNPSKRPLNLLEPLPEKGVPKPPKHLGQEARKYWDHFAEILTNMDVITLADEAALCRLCETYAEVIELQLDIELEGRTYRTFSREGNLTFRTRPEVRLLQETDRRLRGYLADFGLTPASRSKVSRSPAKDHPNAFEKYFKVH